MNKKHARDALDIYKKFLIRMDRVAEFLKVAEVCIFLKNSFLLCTVTFKYLLNFKVLSFGIICAFLYNTLDYFFYHLKAEICV